MNSLPQYQNRSTPSVESLKMYIYIHTHKHTLFNTHTHAHTHIYMYMHIYLYEIAPSILEQKYALD